MNAEILRIDPDEPEPALIDRVVECLNSGNVAALPTDTTPPPPPKPLSLLIADVSQAYELARGIDIAFDRLAERFWPGPLTVIVKAGGKLPLRVTANTGNVALRVP